MGPNALQGPAAAIPIGAVGIDGGLENLNIFKMLLFLAEARGFEPPVPVSEYNDLANRRLKPLGHASVGESYKEGTHRYQARDRTVGQSRDRPGAAVPQGRDRYRHRHRHRRGAAGAPRREAGSSCGPRVDGVWSAPLRRPIWRAVLNALLLTESRAALRDAASTADERLVPAHGRAWHHGGA